MADLALDNYDVVENDDDGDDGDNDDCSDDDTTSIKIHYFNEDYNV
jgi:hypothetical protein